MTCMAFVMDPRSGDYECNTLANPAILRGDKSSSRQAMETWLAAAEHLQLAPQARSALQEIAGALVAKPRDPGASATNHEQANPWTSDGWTCVDWHPSRSWQGGGLCAMALISFAGYHRIVRRLEPQVARFGSAPLQSRQAPLVQGGVD